MFHVKHFTMLSPVPLRGKMFQIIKRITFEHLIDRSKKQPSYDACDDWLCRLHQLWKRIKIENFIETDVFSWIKPCACEHALYPDGTVVHRCPQLEPFTLCSLCVTCPYDGRCIQCRLHECCTYPKNCMNWSKKSGDNTSLIFLSCIHTSRQTLPIRVHPNPRCSFRAWASGMQRTLIRYWCEQLEFFHRRPPRSR